MFLEVTARTFPKNGKVIDKTHSESVLKWTWSEIKTSKSAKTGMFDWAVQSWYRQRANKSKYVSMFKALLGFCSAFSALLVKSTYVSRVLTCPFIFLQWDQRSNICFISL